MASVLAEIYQIFILLYTTNNSLFRSLIKTITVIPSSLLPVTFSNLELSNIANLSESDLFTATSTNLDISIKVLNSFILLSLEVSILTFSSTYTSSLLGENFLFWFLFIYWLANKFLLFSFFSFFNLYFLSIRSGF